MDELIEQKSLKILGDNSIIDRSVAAGQLSLRLRFDGKEANVILRSLERRGAIKINHRR